MDLQEVIQLTKRPLITSGPIDKDKYIPVTTSGGSVTKTNVNMDFVKIPVVCAFDGFTLWSFVDRSERPKTFWKFSCADPFTISSDLKKIQIVVEGTTTSNAM